MQFKFLLFLFFGCQLSFSQTIKPYLQAAKPTSIYVNWKTDNGSNPSVIYGTSSTDLSFTETGSTVNLEPKDSDYSTPYHYHSVKLTNLLPSTGYYYQVFSGEDDKSEVHYFKTPPEPGNSDGILRFIALGDHQIINYQGKPYFKFDELVKAAKAKAIEEYGSPVADHFNLIINDGDQVDLGKLTHYEQIHFKKSSYLSPELPIITAVGNHETYGSTYKNGGIQAYYDHFVLDDDFEFNTINSNTERYYSYQLANVLFIVLDTESTNNIQLNWATDVINQAEQDDNVDYIITIAHRPYQAEQYSNDYSPWYGNQIVPVLETTDKFILHIAGHHHMYARGQFKNHNAYHMISGGTAWPQYWGDSSNEDDREETQGSWSNFAYQLIEIDNPNQEITVKSYSIGSLYTEKDSELIDEFHYKLGVEKPNQPTITNEINGPIALPYTLTGSEYATPSSESLNSAQFQIGSTSDFSIINIDKYQHVTNFYGPLNGAVDETENIGLGEHVINYSIKTGELTNGNYYARVRYRDENLGWSEWSKNIQFEVAGSENGEPSLFLNQPSYLTGEEITTTFQNAPAESKTDWIGIYNYGNKPGTNGSVAYAYLNGIATGTKTFQIHSPGVYFASLFENDGYVQITEPVNFWVGSKAKLSTSQEQFQTGETVNLTYENHPNQSNDWIGVYRVGDKAQSNNEVRKVSINTSSSNINITDLEDGYYYAVYHVSDTYVISGEKVDFQVGDRITSISLNKDVYGLDEPIKIEFNNAPGIEKDYIGIIIDDGKPAGTENLFTYKYFGGLANGETTITGTDNLQGSPNQLPPIGEYYLAMFTDDSYTEVSNRVPITVIEALEPKIELITDNILVGQPIIVEYSNGPGGATDWIGIYKEGNKPGGPTSTTWDYVNEDNYSYGSVTLGPINTAGNYFVSFFINDGYEEIVERIPFTVKAENQTKSILSVDCNLFETENSIKIDYTNAPGNNTDWVAIYPKGIDPGTGTPSTTWAYVDEDNVATGSVSLEGISEPGDYYITLLEDDGYNEIAERIDITILNQVTQTTLITNPIITNSPIEVAYSNGPGNTSDWIAVYPAGVDPGSGTQSVTWDYIDQENLTEGMISLEGITTAGDYYLVFLENDSYKEVSCRLPFTVEKATVKQAKVSLACSILEVGEEITVHYSGGPGNATDWLGFYPMNVEPGTGTPSTTWDYVEENNLSTGSITLAGIDQPGKYYLTFLENDGYSEIAERIVVDIYESKPMLEIPDTIIANQNIELHYKNLTIDSLDWVGIYQLGQNPENARPVTWKYLENNSALEGSLILDQLSVVGDYFTAVFKEDGYEETTCRTYFTVEREEVTSPEPEDSIINFSATLLNSGFVELEWNTDIETNNQSFIVERHSGNQLIEQLVIVDPSPSLDYKYLDYSPKKGRNYYRIKSVEVDGSFDTTEEREVFVERPIKGVTIYPNPSTGIATIVSNFDIQSVEVRDVRGKSVNIQWQTDGKMATINLSSASKGLYWVIVTSVNKRRETVSLSLQ